MGKKRRTEDTATSTPKATVKKSKKDAKATKKPVKKEYISDEESEHGKHLKFRWKQPHSLDICFINKIAN